MDKEDEPTDNAYLDVVTPEIQLCNFADSFKDSIIALRIQNTYDPVPHTPTKKFGKDRAMHLSRCAETDSTVANFLFVIDITSTCLCRVS